MIEDRRQRADNIIKKKKNISLLKRVIVILIVTPFLPLFLLISLLVSGEMNSDEITIDERFSLSSSMQSPYKDTLKGSYEYSFAFCGDPHLQQEGDGLFPELDKAIRTNCINFVVFGGDLTFLGKEAEYKNFVKHANALTVPAYPALGNHDLYNNGWLSYWRNLGPSAYSFYGGNAKFIVIDSASGQIGQRQMEWIKMELKSNKQPLLFVISHIPIYGVEYGFYEFPEAEERQELIELLEKYEVDYVLEGHYHGYADINVNGVRYITSGSFSDGLLDEGQRHFLLFRVYGPDVSVEKIIIESDTLVQYSDARI